MTKSKPCNDVMDVTGLLRRVIGRSVGAGVVALVVAAGTWGVSQFGTKTYTAMAVLHLTAPPVYANYKVSPVGATLPTPDDKTLSLLAKSDLVLEQTFSDPTLSAYVGETGRVVFARNKMKSKLVCKTSLRLIVNAADPELAAAVANAWSGVMMARLGEHFGISLETIELLQLQADEQQQRWARLHDQREAGGVTGFEAEKLDAETEAIRHLYIALVQGVEQAKISRAASHGAVALASPAVVPTEPSHPQPRQYAWIAGLFTLAVGVFLVLVRELSRLDR